MNVGHQQVDSKPNTSPITHQNPYHAHTFFFSDNETNDLSF